MKILHLSDFNCPYSYIGLNRLKDALSELDLDAEWEMRSFELEPNARNLSTIDRHSIRHGLSREDAIKEIEEIEEIARSEGLDINYGEMVINSSRDAHRLVKYVQENHPEASEELVLKIFESNLILNENIASHEVLLNIAASCGLDEDEIAEFLKSESLKIEVYLDADEAISNGISTVPYYFIEHDGERLIVPGVFEKESFKTAFRDLLSGEMKEKTFL